jgi:hypothetical protein
VFAFDLFIVFFVFILVPRHKSRESVKIGPHPRGHPSSSALVEFLRERWEIFAWFPSDMPGVPRGLVEHTLNVDPKAKPVKQPLQRFDEPKRKAIASELHRLENAGFIREIKSTTWVSNPVIIPKKNTDVQRVCVDYTSLNKHCPKHPFPLPRID